MKRVVQILVLAALVIAACWFWTVLFPSPEAVIRGRLNSLAKTLSFNSQSGMVSQAFAAEKAADFFTTDVDIDVNVTGDPDEPTAVSVPSTLSPSLLPLMMVPGWMVRVAPVWTVVVQSRM